jgi:HSP20 family protein
MLATTHFAPITEMLSLHEALGRLLDNSLVHPDFAFTNAAAMSFPVTVLRDGDALKVEALLPGIRPDDIDIDIDQGQLTITAKYHDEGTQEGEAPILREFARGQVTRSFSLPFPVEVEHVGADFVNGALTLTLPIAEEAKPKRIAIGGPQGQLPSSAQHEPATATMA